MGVDNINKFNADEIIGMDKAYFAFRCGFLLQQPSHFAAGTASPFRRVVLNRFHHPADRERMGWIEQGMPVVRQEHPGAEQEAVFLAAFADHLRQTGLF